MNGLPKSLKLRVSERRSFPTLTDCLTYFEDIQKGLEYRNNDWGNNNNNNNSNNNGNNNNYKNKNNNWNKGGNGWNKNGNGK